MTAPPAFSARRLHLLFSAFLSLGGVQPEGVAAIRLNTRTERASTSRFLLSNSKQNKADGTGKHSSSMEQGRRADLIWEKGGAPDDVEVVPQPSSLPISKQTQEREEAEQAEGSPISQLQLQKQKNPLVQGIGLLFAQGKAAQLFTVAGQAAAGGAGALAVQNAANARALMPAPAPSGAAAPVAASGAAAGNAPDAPGEQAPAPASVLNKGAEGGLSDDELSKRKRKIREKVEDFVKARREEDEATWESVAGLEGTEVDDAITYRELLSGQAAFTPFPREKCKAQPPGPACLFPGMAGADNGQGLNLFSRESLNGPAAAHVALSWDPELIYYNAYMMGAIFRHSIKNAVLGPGAQVWRNPNCGRSWEYIPGEDPILGVLLVEAWTLGYNAQKVSPVLKHFINNDKEKDRMHKRGRDAVPWEAQMDIYLKPFVAGSNVGASATMCGYHWLADPGEDGEDKAVSMCYNKRNKWLIEQSARTWMVSDYPAMEMEPSYLGRGRSQAGFSYANIPPGHKGYNKENYHILEYEKRDAQQQLTNSIGIAEEDNGHQVMAKHIDQADRRLKTEYLAGWVGWAKELGIQGSDVLPYTTKECNGAFERLTDDRKEKFYERTSRTIAESFVLLKNDGNILPLKSTDRVFLDDSCKGPDAANLLIANGSGEMAIHLLGTPAELAFKGKTAEAQDAAAVHLTCTLEKASEGSDRAGVASKRPPIGNKAKTCAFVSTPGSISLAWADDVACIVMGIVPAVLGFNGLQYFFYGYVNPGGHTIMSVVQSPDDLEFSDGDSKHETAYMMLQAKGKAPVFEFGWGLPFGATSWDDVAEIVPAQHDRTIRRIAFCFRGKAAAPAEPVPPPNPTAQFWYQVKGSKFKQLLTFVKHRGLKNGAEVCSAAYYDPVTEWEGGEGGKYVRRDFDLFYGLNGYSAAAEWPKSLESGKDEVQKFSRKEYPKHVWARHFANQIETGNEEKVGRIFTEKGKTSQSVIDFWERQESPTVHETRFWDKNAGEICKAAKSCPQWTGGKSWGTGGEFEDGELKDKKKYPFLTDEEFSSALRSTCLKPAKWGR